MARYQTLFSISLKKLVNNLRFKRDISPFLCFPKLRHSSPESLKKPQNTSRNFAFPAFPINRYCLRSFVSDSSCLIPVCLILSTPQWEAGEWDCHCLRLKQSLSAYKFSAMIFTSLVMMFSISTIMILFFFFFLLTYLAQEAFALFALATTKIHSFTV